MRSKRLFGVGSNFRIYKNKQKLYFVPEKGKNVFIIAGNNGYGKTTFLTALVWCLYGKYMKDVDEVYKSQINEIGGYTNFLKSCLNRLALKESDREFYVSITFADIDVPSLPCNEIKVIRKGFYNRGIDEIKIFIDGYENELTKEVGNELFIQDFIMPKEIAKFFFFDSEKIVALAESKSLASKRQLSKAYSEVLGIQKYVNLKKNLEDLIFRFKRDSAKPADKKKLELLTREVTELEKYNVQLIINLEQKEEEKIQLKKQSENLQEKLIREGSALSIDEINNLKIDKKRIEKQLEELKQTFKSILDLAPFAIVGKLLSHLQLQLQKESQQSLSNQQQQILNKKGLQLLKAFNKIKPTNSLKVNKDAIGFYQKEMEKLVSKFLVEDIKIKTSSKDSIVTLHDFSEEEYKKFNTLFLQLKTSYANQVKDISTNLSKTRLQFGRISKKLSNAESKETDGIIAKYREEKVRNDKNIILLEKDITEINQQLGAIQIQINSKRKVVEGLQKKVTVQERFIEKDKLAKRLIKELDNFIVNIKKEKKQALETKILHGLKTLMHKKDFIAKVVVEVGEDIIDILLFDTREEEIDKDTLSKWEQQLYATSILRALVEESNIEFPVFIDSPLQKFDSRHAKNIIADFYPAISKQVILFPLLKKEMTEDEYGYLEDKVKSAFIIKNEQQDFSYFMPINPLNLFEAVKKIEANVL